MTETRTPLRINDRTVHLGEINDTSELFERLEPIRSAPVTNTRRPPVHRFPSYDGKLDCWVTDYASVHLKGEESKRTLPIGARVMPTAEVIGVIGQWMVHPSQDSISFEIIEWADGRALVTARNSVIIGGAWLAMLTPHAVAQVREAMTGTGHDCTCGPTRVEWRQFHNPGGDPYEQRVECVGVHDGQCMTITLPGIRRPRS